MQITERVAKLLTRFQSGDQRAFVDEYLLPLQDEVRKHQNFADLTNDLLRLQGQARLLNRMLKDIEEAPAAVARFEKSRR